jgi:hypothetical protein
VFKDRRGREIGDIAIPGVDTEPIEPDGPAGVDIDEVLDPNDEGADEPDLEAEVAPEEADEPDLEAEVAPYADGAEEDDGPEEEEIPGVAEEIPGVPHQEDPGEIPGVPDETPGVRRSTRVRVQAKQAYEPSMTGSKYDIAMAQLQNEGVLHPDSHMMFFQAAEEQPDVVAAIMTQLSLKAGLKQWGDEAHEAVHSEMKQLHFRDTFKPMHHHELTEDQKKTVLESHMFLKQKRDGKIKGRTVAGGNKQRDFISKEDSSSPTVSIEAVLLSCIIDAEEGRDVAVIDIPNAFIQTRIEDEKDMAIIKIRGVLMDMLLEIAPEVYGPYVTTDKKGVKQLITQCLNAIYGTMVASLLYYIKFVKTLKRNDFALNPYDPCTANRMVNGMQQTCVWHVDDCKLSCVDTEVQDEFIETL